MNLGPQEITFKRSVAKSVLLIANDVSVISEIDQVVADIPKHDLETKLGTLSGMNGHAVDFAKSNDLVIFETKGGHFEDLDAMSALRDELDQEVKILAVTKDDITLAEARRITRAGANEILTFPFDREDLRDQVVRLTSPNPLVVVPQPAVPSGTPGVVIAISKSRGGNGSTTVAVNLADQLQGKSGFVKRKIESRVIVVDLDLQFGAVASFLDVDPSDALYRLAEDGTVPDGTFLQQSIVTAKCGLDVLAAPERIAPLHSLTNEQIGAIIESLKAEYDYVIVDLPQALVEWLSPVLEKADRLLLVTDSSVPSVRQARRLIDFFTTDNVALPIEIVVNREKKPVIKGGTAKEAENVLERPLRYWLPKDERTARAAVDRGEPLQAVSGRSTLTKAFGRFAKTLADDVEEKRKAQTLSQGRAS